MTEGLSLIAPQRRKLIHAPEWSRRELYFGQHSQVNGGSIHSCCVFKRGPQSVVRVKFHRRSVLDNGKDVDVAERLIAKGRSKAEDGLKLALG